MIDPDHHRSRSALFVSVPAIGHLTPLLLQAAELRRRGWRVALASLEEMREYVENTHPDIRFVSLGANPAGFADQALRARVSAATSFVSGTLEIMRSVNRLWTTMYDGLCIELQRDRPAVLVVDLITSAGMDAAEVAGIPYVVNNADLLPSISVALLPPAPSVPLLFSGRSIHSINRVDRLLNPLLCWLGATAVDLTFGAELNRLRRRRGLPARRVTRRLADVLIMTDSAFGLEYGRPLPPRIQMVGPMLDDRISDAQTDELQGWLDVGPPVAFVNLGTLARPESGVLDQIARGLQSTHFRALWVLRESVPNLSPNIRVERWVPSQIATLAHPNVRVFVSHCGINSVHESLHAGTPVVGLPIMADQRDMAQRVQDAGVGLFLDKGRLTADALRQAIETVLHEPKFTRNIAPIQSSFALAGGVRRAADLIEHAAAYGVVGY